MKVIIAGGRDHAPTPDEERCVRAVLAHNKATEVVSGGARGVDLWGENLAGLLGLTVKRFPADWERHGRSAGPIRNKQMADYADALIALPGGRGTANMVATARRLDLKVFDLR